jgi:hypothetical protein
MKGKQGPSMPGTAMVRTGSSSGMEGLIETAFHQIQRWGESDAAARLFPHGLGSLELELGTAAEGRVSLRLSGTTAGTAAESAMDTVTLLEGGVEATFNAEGHHIVALITEQDLTRQFPATMRKVQKILDDGGRTFLKAATFPDEIRQFHPETKPFHFVDIPFEEGGPPDQPLPGAPHIISKIADFSDRLKHGSSAQEKVDALSWLIHLFGDIHQPLHCTERISSLHPGGDRGGNSFLLKGTAKNLHSLWDSSVSFSNHDDDAQLARDIIQQHSRTALDADLQVTEVEKWARASFSLALGGLSEEGRENRPPPSRPGRLSPVKPAARVARVAKKHVRAGSKRGQVPAWSCGMKPARIRKTVGSGVLG